MGIQGDEADVLTVCKSLGFKFQAGEGPCSCRELQSSSVPPARRQNTVLPDITHGQCRSTALHVPACEPWRCRNRGIKYTAIVTSITYCMSGKNSLGRKVTTRFHILTLLGMSGVVPLLSLHVFTLCTETISPVRFYLIILPVAYRYAEMLRFRCHVVLHHW